MKTSRHGTYIAISMEEKNASCISVKAIDENEKPASMAGIVFPRCAEISARSINKGRKKTATPLGCPAINCGRRKGIIANMVPATNEAARSPVNRCANFVIISPHARKDRMMMQL